MPMMMMILLPINDLVGVVAKREKVHPGALPCPTGQFFTMCIV